MTEIYNKKKQEYLELPITRSLFSLMKYVDSDDLFNYEINHNDINENIISFFKTVYDDITNNRFRTNISINSVNKNSLVTSYIINDEFDAYLIDILSSKLTLYNRVTILGDVKFKKNQSKINKFSKENIKIKLSDSLYSSVLKTILSNISLMKFMANNFMLYMLIDSTYNIVNSKNEITYDVLTDVIDNYLKGIKLSQDDILKKINVKTNKSTLTLKQINDTFVNTEENVYKIIAYILLIMTEDTIRLTYSISEVIELHKQFYESYKQEIDNNEEDYED